MDNDDTTDGVAEALDGREVGTASVLTEGGGVVDTDGEVRCSARAA